MKARNRKSFLWLLTMMMAATSSVALAADVDVFAEGAYTANDLVVYIYANINTGNLCSYGIMLNYDTINNRLNVPTATKNENVWYFGTSSVKQPYMNPDTSTPGQVVFIGGKLDAGSPAAGVTGTRVLLGKATFTRKESTMGFGTTAQDYFGISLALGKAAPYDNFVTTGGEVKDGATAFGPIIVRERGDANASGSITVRDIATVKELMGVTDSPVYADCNASDSITVRDIACIKEKLQ